MPASITNRQNATSMATSQRSRRVRTRLTRSVNHPASAEVATAAPTASQGSASDPQMNSGM